MLYNIISIVRQHHTNNNPYFLNLSTPTTDKGTYYPRIEFLSMFCSQSLPHHAGQAHVPLVSRLTLLESVLLVLLRTDNFCGLTLGEILLQHTDGDAFQKFEEAKEEEEEEQKQNQNQTQNQNQQNQSTAHTEQSHADTHGHGHASSGYSSPSRQKKNDLAASSPHSHDSYDGTYLSHKWFYLYTVDVCAIMKWFITKLRPRFIIHPILYIHTTQASY